MQALLSFVVFAVLSDFISCNHHVQQFPVSNSSALDSLKGVAERTKEEISDRLSNLTEAVEHKWEIVHDIIEGGQNDNESTTVVGEFDSDGCDRKLLKHFEDRCDEVYEKVSDEAQMIEDDEERKEAVCCALEDFEKCSLRAYDQANCVTDKNAIRENLKAARLFLSVIANITCNEFRGQCAYYNSAVVNYSGYAIVVFSVLVQLAKYWSL